MRVLILTASAGNGHNSTSKIFKNEIEQNYANSEVKIVDVFKSFANGYTKWGIEKGYSLVCDNFVGLYNYFFKKCEKFDIKKSEKASVHTSIRSVLYGLLHEIYEFKPDLIISAYIMATVALNDLRLCYEIPAQIMCMTLDYGVSPYWECTTNIDKQFLTGQYMVQPFLDRGFKESQLVVSGIPVGRKFYEQKDKITTRRQLGLNEDNFTIVVMKSGFFPLKENVLIRELAKINKEAQIVIINGKSTKSKITIDKLIEKNNIKNIISLGFVNNVDEYYSSADLILGKAGGLSTTEALAKQIPTLIVNKLPMQEYYNMKYLVDNKCAKLIDKPSKLHVIANQMIESSLDYDIMIHNINKIRNDKTLSIFNEYFNTVESADYSNINLKDSPYKVNQNVKKALRQNYNKKQVR